MRSSHGRGNKCESNRIRHAFGRMIRPCSLAIVAALPQRRVGHLASPSSRRWTTSFITGEHKSRRWRDFRRTVTTYSEPRRQVVHVVTAAFALLLRYLTWPEAAALAIAAIAFNVFAL